VHFKSVQRLTAVKKLLPRAHWEMRRGTHEQAKEYCMKPESRIEGPWTQGKEPAQGERNDLHAVMAAITPQSKLRDIAELNRGLFARYGRGITQFHSMVSAPRNHKTEVVVIWGKTGVGKTRSIMDNYPHEEIYIHNGTKWWEHYDHQPVVVLDEFYGQIAHSEMLKLMDRYPHRVECKGGSYNFSPHVIIITSNKSPWEFYKMEHDWKPAFFRRIGAVYHINDVGIHKADIGPDANLVGYLPVERIEFPHLTLLANSEGRSDADERA